MSDRSNLRAVAGLSTGVMLGVVVASAQALECPEPQRAGEPGVITETPGQIADLAPVLAGGDVSAEIAKIVAALQKRYPTAGPVEVANYLIAAYCPGVAKAAGVSDAEKTARVRAFSKAVLAVLY